VAGETQLLLGDRGCGEDNSSEPLAGQVAKAHDMSALLGQPMGRFLRELIEEVRGGGRYQSHFVTAREMVNINLAACDGRNGNPRLYRDYRFRNRPTR
jgi:hypothetical protein